MRTTPFQWYYSLTLDGNADDTPEIIVSEANQGAIFIPSTATMTALGFRGAPKVGEEYGVLRTSAGAVLSLTVSAGNVYQLPAECFGCGALKITSDANEQVSISLKG